MPNPIQQLLEQISPGFRPTEPDYGMSPQSEVVKQALGAYQAQGEKPPMPADGGVPPLLQLLEFLQRMQANGGMQPIQDNVGPSPLSPAQEMQALNTPGAASANSAQNQALLRALLTQ